MTVKEFLSKFLSLVYRPLDFSLEEFENSLKPIFDHIRRNNKDLCLVGDYNISVLDYEDNVKVKNFVNFVFQDSLIPLINQNTKVTRRNATAIDHILNNAFFNKQIETGIIKTEFLNHFPMFLITDTITSSETNNKRTLIYKRTINTATKKNF